MPFKRGDSDRKEPRVFSRRTLLSGGFGLAAAACGSPSGGGRGIEDGRAEPARSNQRVVGRARQFPLSPGSEVRDTLGARHFPQPVELTINQVDNRDKNLVLEVDYCDGSSRGCRPGGYPLLERVFAIDCARYDCGQVEDKYVVELNTAEEWTLRNLGGAGHPFHIHVKPFQVVEIFDGKTRTVFDPQSARWQDVVAIPRGSVEAPGYVKIRQRYLTFPSDFVIHCHFLNHEDMGRMKRVWVVARGGATGRPPCQRVGECSGG